MRRLTGHAAPTYNVVCKMNACPDANVAITAYGHTTAHYPKSLGYDCISFFLLF